MSHQVGMNCEIFPRGVSLGSRCVSDPSIADKLRLKKDVDVNSQQPRGRRIQRRLCTIRSCAIRVLGGGGFADAILYSGKLVGYAH